MENNILAPRDGIVEKVNVKAGRMVDGSKPVLMLQALEE
jgi:biotin carboxyl carrier protein